MSGAGAQSYIAMIKQVIATPTVIPATPVMQKVNFLNETLSTKLETAVSDHITGSRGTTDVKRRGISIGGGYTFDFTFLNSLDDELLEAALWTDAAWAAGGSLDEFIKDGSTGQPFFIERGHTDIGLYYKFIGAYVSKWGVEVKDQSDVTGSIEFMCLSSEDDTAIETGATYTAATTNQAFSTFLDVAEIRIDGTATSACKVKDLSLMVDNRVTAKTGLGTFGAGAINAHRLLVEGDISMYVDDLTMQTRFRNGTAFSLDFTLTDSSSQSYKFILPRVKLNENEANVTGIDDDFMDNAKYTALYDSVTGCTINIERTTPA